MFRRLFVSLFAAWAGLMAIATTAHSDPAFPPGSRVGLEVPGDLKPSTHFPGFEDADRKVSIAILDLPSTAYFELETAAFSKLPQDLQQAKRESFPFNTGIGFLISGVTQKDGTTVHRWSLLAQAAGDKVQNLTTLINVEVPESALPVYSDAVVRQALASVTFRPAPIKEQLSLLPFRFGDLAGFEVLQVTPTGTVVLADKPDDESTARRATKSGRKAKTRRASRCRWFNGCVSARGAICVSSAPAPPTNGISSLADFALCAMQSKCG